MSHGFRPLPFTSGSSAVLTLLAGRILPSISYYIHIHTYTLFILKIFRVPVAIQLISSRFRVGFNPASVSLKSATQNMPSASLQPSVIDDYLSMELAKGHVTGPFSSPLLPHLHISRFGVIPKKHQPGKWHLILDLSSPDGHSVNDTITKDPFTVQYMKVDHIIDGIMSLGRGTLLAKFDVESAYRIIPIHPND